MGRLRVPLLNIVAKPFDKKVAAESIAKRMGNVSDSEVLAKILTELESTHNRQVFMAAIRGKKK